nr:NADH dehydrogenase subunit 4 [Sternoptyx obscura]
MLMVLVPTVLIYLTIWLSPVKWFWSFTLLQSLVVAFMSLTWFSELSGMEWLISSSYLACDPLSLSLLVLSCWLLPLMILASQNHVSLEPVNRQRVYLSLLVSLQLFLIFAFGATEVIMFYVMFEATLLPTLFIITRWGKQTERLSAGTYFLFFTLVGSLPLLVSLFFLQKSMGTLSLLTLQFNTPLLLTTWADVLWGFCCLAAFLVKLPLYGAHLWLPKAHVEAPIAGSMVLAAVLLKLGGYGMMRVIPLLDPVMSYLAYPVIALALWGIVVTGVICLRQTDLKSLIAYSSVGHMGLVVGGVLIQTPWGLSGALILMIAHGLTSSALFCLANVGYERTHSRTMLFARGMQMILPLMATWWFIASLANLAFPPFPNLMGELLIIASMFNWSCWTFLLTGVGTLITAAYSLHLFMTSQWGQFPDYALVLEPSHTREHLLLVLHLLPVLLLIWKPELIWGVCF